MFLKCECVKTPCKCQSFQRGTTCEYKIIGKFKCDKSGQLRTDCNLFSKPRLVLCPEHYLMEYRHVNRKCRMCGQKGIYCTC